MPINLTKEIIDEISILYKEDPIYQVVDSKGKALPKDQELWEQIQEQTRYQMFMDKVDRWCNLLGTVLVKVSFVNPKTGQLVDETEGGQVQLDILHGGSYDLKHGASPYYITELLIGFGTKFNGFAGNSPGVGNKTYGVGANIPDGSSYGAADITARHNVTNPGQLGNVNRIYWSPDSHKQVDEENNEYQVENPYGVIPAVPFFNSDPAHYYFLPINEPLIYANHALNMRITDLNHIAKFQSFGVPVLSGVERPTSTRQGRPVDDFNLLKGGSAQSRFGGLSGVSGFGAGGNFRTFDHGLGINRDGNADAASLGFTIGPDTAIAVGEKGDFKFAHPSADIKGLILSIQSIADMVRINHGLRPKFSDSLPASGFARLMEKIGVIDNNRRRKNLFREREQQLFQVIKKLYNTHFNDSGEKKFSEEAKLKITYVEPKFPVDPKTEMDTIIMESQIWDSGDTQSIKKLYPHLSDSDIKKMFKQRRKDKEEQIVADAQAEAARVKTLTSELGEEKAKLVLGIKPESDTGTAEKKTAKAKIDNRVKHAADSSKQPKRNGQQRDREQN